MTLVETRAAARSLETFAVRRAARRAECTNLVDLARRMSVPPDEAIRQLIDRNQRRETGRTASGRVVPAGFGGRHSDILNRCGCCIPTRLRS